MTDTIALIGTETGTATGTANTTGIANVRAKDLVTDRDGMLRAGGRDLPAIPQILGQVGVEVPPGLLRYLLNRSRRNPQRLQLIRQPPQPLPLPESMPNFKPNEVSPPTRLRSSPPRSLPSDPNLRPRRPE